MNARRLEFHKHTDNEARASRNQMYANLSRSQQLLRLAKEANSFEDKKELWNASAQLKAQVKRAVLENPEALGLLDDLIDFAAKQAYENGHTPERLLL